MWGSPLAKPAWIASALFSQAVWALDVDGCTSIVVGKGASVDGSAMVSHANDCQDCDFRMVYVPARDYPEGASRPLYDAVWSQFPRLVDPSRSPQYQAGEGITQSNVLGSIPQVSHTYALWESTYSLMNEKGLALGESTCAAKLFGNATASGGTALLSVGNLMTLALERCETARCAIQTMGDLGAKYGFFGEEEGMPGAGEAVTVTDASGEAWVFHITGGLPDPPAGQPAPQYAGQRGALWAAQRVPDGHVAVVANNFIIREVDPADTDNFVLHPGLFDLAKEAGLWSGSGSFDFLQVMAPDIRYFSYNPLLPPIPWYTALRMWGVLRQAAPSKNFQPTDNPADFPFSVLVDEKVSHLNVMDWFRSHYEGTPFDMRLGVLAGPFQSPNRIEGGAGLQAVPGQFARSTSISRTSYTMVAQSGIKEPVVWFAPDASASSVFVPFFASTLRGSFANRFDIESFGSGSMKSFSFTDVSTRNAWWAFDFVANWMELHYQNMSEAYVYPKVAALQREVAEATEAALKEAGDATDDAEIVLAAAQTQIQRQVVAEWWEFAGKLVVRYNDHFFNFPEGAPTAQFPTGYPAFWLEMIGFNNRNYHPTWVRPAEEVPSLLPIEQRRCLDGGARAAEPRDSEAATAALRGDAGPVLESASRDFTGLVYCYAATSAISALVGYALGHRRATASAAGVPSELRAVLL